MYDLGAKTYLNLLIPSSDASEETENKSGGLLSRSKPMANKSMKQENKDLMNLTKIVSNIRNKRKALKNG
tara:strand:- start:1448 stop:1657 length:210 start_codon:yes stop_codon:yes gene_type:complete